MSQEKPIDTMAGQDCPFCARGRFEICQVDYKATTSDEPEVTVKGVWVERCSACGEMVFPSESSRYIDAVLAEESEQLTPAQLEQIRKRLGVDQTEMSEILGLGGRTYHRWEKGSQYPSRSMSYYIRALAEFPETFAWIQERGWRVKRTVLRFPTSQEELAEWYPDLALMGYNIERITPISNPARGLTAVEF